MKLSKKTYLIICICLILYLLISAPVLLYWNQGKSISTGAVSNGAIGNAYKFNLYGKNYSYFSYLSYFNLGMCFTNNQVYQSLIDCFKELETKAAGRHFYVMELSRKKGGKTILHATHRNGLSADIMVPKKFKKGGPTYLFDHLGLWHYLLEFDKEGSLKIAPFVQIDFEALASFIHELNLSCQKNKLIIQRIIIRHEIKDNLNQTKLAPKIMRFIQSYPNNIFVNSMHDDHIHIDFRTI